MTIRKTILFTSALTLLGAGATYADDKKSADIKPALAKDGFDEEQMRITKLIHKRNLENKASKGGSAIDMKAFKV